MRLLNKISLLFSCTVLLSSCGGGETSERVEEMVQKINQKCPAMVDEETQLTHVAYDKKNTITYSYHLVHVQADMVDTAAFRKLLWPGLLANIKVDHDMKDLRDASFSFVYDYRDKAGKPILALNINPSNYRDSTTKQ